MKQLIPQSQSGVETSEDKRFRLNKDFQLLLLLEQPGLDHRVVDSVNPTDSPPPANHNLYNSSGCFLFVPRPH